MDGLVRDKTDRRKVLLTYHGELLHSEDHLHIFIAEVEEQNLFFFFFFSHTTAVKKKEGKNVLLRK